AVLFELGEEFFEFLDLVQLLVLLEALVAFFDGFLGLFLALGAGDGFLVDPDFLVAEELIAVGGGVEKFLLAIDDDLIERQAAVLVAFFEEFGEGDASALNDLDELFELAEQLDDAFELLAAEAAGLLAGV